MLQSLAGKLNRLNDVRQIGATIATELRLLIDYHNCRVFLRDGDDLLPIAFVGEFDTRLGCAADVYATKVGQGITGPGRRDAASRCSSRTRSSASSPTGFPARRSSRSRSRPCRCATARASPARS